MELTHEQPKYVPVDNIQHKAPNKENVKTTRFYNRSAETNQSKPQHDQEIEQ